MAFCVKCGAEIPEGAYFCFACGNALPDEDEALRTVRVERINKRKALFAASIEEEINHILITGIISLILSFTNINNYLTGYLVKAITSDVNIDWIIETIITDILGNVPMGALGAIILSTVTIKRIEGFNRSYGAYLDDRLTTGKKLAKAGKTVGIIMLILSFIYFLVMMSKNSLN